MSPRPRGARRHQGADARRRDRLRHPRAAQGAASPRRTTCAGCCGDWVVEVAHSGNLVVLRTPPGSAHVVGLGPRPLRPARRARHRRRRRHDARGRGVRALGGAAMAAAPQRPGRSGLTGPARHPTARTPDRRNERTMAKRVVLAYSGGLDTSVAVRWMIENCGVEVITVACDVGQEGDWEGTAGQGARRRRRRGHRGRLPRGVRPRLPRAVLKANALYEGKYPLVSALSRPVIVQPPGRRRPLATAPTPWPTAAPARATTRCASRSSLGPSPPTSRCSPRCATGASPARTRSSTPRPHDIPVRRHQGEAVLHRRQPLGPCHRVRRDGGPVGPAARGRVAA